jgi:hypothetical protein
VLDRRGSNAARADGRGRRQDDLNVHANPCLQSAPSSWSTRGASWGGRQRPPSDTRTTPSVTIFPWARR